MTSSTARIVGLLALVGFLVLQGAAWGEEDVDVFGLSLPMWVFATVLYLLGVIAGWAAGRSKQSPS